MIAVAIAAVILGVIALTSALSDNTSKADKVSESVQELSNKLYKLNESSNAIKKAISNFEDFDNKIIKTKEDIESMKESMSSVADSID